MGMNDHIVKAHPRFPWSRPLSVDDLDGSRRYGCRVCLADNAYGRLERCSWPTITEHAHHVRTDHPEVLPNATP